MVMDAIYAGWWNVLQLAIRTSATSAWKRVGVTFVSQMSMTTASADSESATIMTRFREMRSTVTPLSGASRNCGVNTPTSNAA